MLWVHVSVIDTPDGENTSEQYKQMQQFNPALSDQDDDHLDSLARAITDSPERVGKIHNKEQHNERLIGGQTVVLRKPPWILKIR